MIFRLFISNSETLQTNFRITHLHWLKGLVLFLAALSLQFLLMESFERFLYHFETTFSPASKYETQLSQSIEGVLPEPALNAPMYVYDEYGFRTWGIDYANKKGKRIVFVGSNSIGMGYGVKVHESFPAQFWKTMARLRPNTPIEVINVNLPGNPLPKNMALLKEIFFEHLQPDVIIYGEYLYSTDHFFPSLNHDSESNNIFEAQHINFATGEIQNQEQNTTAQAYIEHSAFWNYLVEHSLLMAKFLSYVDSQWASFTRDNSRAQGRGSYHQRAGYLYDLNHFLTSQHIPLLVVALPNTAKTPLHQALYEVSKAQGIPYFPLDKKRDFSTYTLVEAGHYSAQTNALLGEEMAAWFDSLVDDELKIKPRYVF